jgi:hypothetical protein
MGIAVVVVLGIVAGAAFIPRWWAQRIGDQVDGSIASGTLIGLTYGFLFTLLPLVVVGAAVRWARSWQAWALAALAAIALALPNLLTLGVVVGRGNAAHAGDRTLDVEAPAFRGASLAGALIAVLVAILVAYLVVSRARTRRALASSRRAMREAEERTGDDDGGTGPATSADRPT